MNGSKLTTGIADLDREMSGGIRGGSIIALEAPARSPSEQLLYEVAKQRTTLYLTTTRSEESVRGALRAADGFNETHNCFVGDVDASDVEADALMQGCMERIEEMLSRMKSDKYDLEEQEFNIIIDTADILEREKYGWLTKFFKNLRKMMSQVDSEALVLLHCTDGENPPPQRDLTLSMADTVWQLDMKYEGDELAYRLFMPKNRGDNGLMEAFKLEFTGSVDVDTSRDIS